MAIVIKRGTRMFSGPDVPTVRTWISEGRIVPSDLVDHQGKWVPIGEHPDFAGIAAAPPPPPPATPQYAGAGKRICPSCKREVASNATTCPHCGKRFTSCVTMGLAMLLAIGGILFVVAIFALASC